MRQLHNIDFLDPKHLRLLGDRNPSIPVGKQFAYSGTVSKRLKQFLSCFELAFWEFDTTQSQLHMQCNSYQNSNDIFSQNRKSNLQFVWNHKRLQYPNNPENEQQSWRDHTF